MTIPLAIIAECDRIIPPKAVSTYDTFPNHRRPVIRLLPVVELEVDVTLGSCPLPGLGKAKIPYALTMRGPLRRRARGTAIQLFFICIHLRMCSCIEVRHLSEVSFGAARAVVIHVCTSL
jgi:hypothetical protein